MHDLRSLQVWYPFMPLDEPNDTLACIKDVRLIVVLPAGNPADMSSVSFSATLVSADATDKTMTFEVACSAYMETPQTYEIRQCTENDVLPMGSSYALVSEYVDIDEDHDETFELHADCLLFLQTAPKLSLQERTGIAAKNQGVVVPGGYVATPKLPYQCGQKILLASGHNVSIEQYDGSIVLTGAAGAGTGMYTESPYIDVAAMGSQAIGLQTINGLSDMVSMQAGASVSLTVAKVGTDTIKVTIAEKA